MLRKAGIGVAVLVILVVAALVAGPHLVDLSYLKGEVAAYVRERTGRGFEIEESP